MENFVNRQKVRVNRVMRFCLQFAGRLLRTRAHHLREDPPIKRWDRRKPAHFYAVRTNETGPYVSVIIPTYNSESFVVPAIESALASMGVAVQVLVVDDSSSDRTLEVISQAFGEDNRVNVYPQHVNRGAYVARNIGLTKARGEFVAFLDSDDWQTPDRLEKQVKPLLQREEIVATYCLLRRWDESLERPLKAIQTGFITSVFRASLVEQLGYFDAVRYSGDAEFRERLFAAFGEDAILQVDEELYMARFRNGGLTGSGEGRIHNLDESGLLQWVPSEGRAQYERNYRTWHVSGESLYMGFPQERRQFALGAEGQDPWRPM